MSDEVTTVGLIVNPVAGMGGSVGLKGTDGGMYDRAVELGAAPVSPSRTREFLRHLRHGGEVRWLVGPGPMGADFVAERGFTHEVIGAARERTGPDDTREIARNMVAAGANLIVFAGGDGTARDIADAIGVGCPVVAIPAGVKVYSSVFAFSARAAASLADAFIDGVEVGEEEVLDIDEEAFRDGRVDARHYGFLLVPESPELLQSGKEASGFNEASSEARQELARTIVEEMEPGVLYLLGSGTTLKSVADALDVDKTLLGIDAVLDGALVGSDLNEKSILALLDNHDRVRVVLTPLGGNGFILGRGNRQLTPAVLKKIGRENIVLVAGREKLMKLAGLHVDTGDPELDRALTGYMEVIVGHGHRKLMKVT